MEYSSAVVVRCAALERARELPPGTPGLVSGAAEDRTLHVWVRFQMQVTEGVVRAVAFQAYGCPHTLAAASLVAERLEGQPVAAARELDVRSVCAPLEVPIEKIGKLLRIEDAVQECWRELTTRT